VTGQPKPQGDAALGMHRIEQAGDLHVLRIPVPASIFFCSGSKVRLPAMPWIAGRHAGHQGCVVGIGDAGSMSRTPSAQAPSPISCGTSAVSRAPLPRSRPCCAARRWRSSARMARGRPPSIRARRKPPTRACVTSCRGQVNSPTMTKPCGGKSPGFSVLIRAPVAVYIPIS